MPRKPAKNANSPVQSRRKKGLRPKSPSPSPHETKLDVSFNVVAPRKRIRLSIYPDYQDLYSLKDVRVSLDRSEVTRRLTAPSSAVTLRRPFVKLDKGKAEQWLTSRLLATASPPARRWGRPPGISKQGWMSNASHTEETQSSDDSEVDMIPIREAPPRRSPLLKVKFPFLFKGKKNKNDSDILSASAVSTSSSEDETTTEDTATQKTLDENANIETKEKVVEKKKKVKRVRNPDEGDDSSSDDDDSDDDSDDDGDNIEKRRERNLADNKRMLAEMMSQFGSLEAFKPAAMNQRRLSLPTAGNGEGVVKKEANRGRRSVTGPWLNLANRQSPPRLRERRDDGRPKYVDPMRRVRSEKWEEGDDDFRVYLDDEDREPEGVFHVKRRAHRTEERFILPVEEVTAKDLKNIAVKLNRKVWDPVNGRSCHQCRQKTNDTKTCCRSDTCSGVRGQFCGACLQKRYGEDIRDALLDPNWTCPPCRGICNCSICRNKAGKCATGSLFDYSQDLGYKSVHHLLAKKTSADEGGDDTQEE